MEYSADKDLFDEIQTPMEEASWFTRTFTGMEKNSLKSTIFLMMAGTIGAGVYTLHHVLDEIGIIWSLMLLLFGCISSLLALDIYIHASKRAGNPNSISEINTEILGNGFNYFATGITGFYIYLMMISFSVCISAILFQIIKGPIAAIFSLNITMDDFMFYHKPICLLIALISFVLVKSKDVSRLAAFSIFCFLVHLYIIMVIISQTLHYFNKFNNQDKAEFNIYSFNKESFFLNFGLAIGAFNNLPNFLMVRNVVRDPSRVRLRKIFGRTNWILLAVYTLTAICGYLTIGHRSVSAIDLMIFRSPEGQTDYFMNIGQLLLTFALIITYCLLSFALKSILLPFIPGNESSKHIWVTGVLVGSAALISMNFKSVTNYINLAGAFCGTLMVIVFPALLALKSGYTKKPILRLLIKIWLLGGAASGLISTYYVFGNVFGVRKV